MKLGEDQAEDRLYPWQPQHCFARLQSSYVVYAHEMLAKSGRMFDTSPRRVLARSGPARTRDQTHDATISQDANPQDPQGAGGSHNGRPKRSTYCLRREERTERGLFTSIGVVGALCLLNTLNSHDRDKLRKQRNRSTQSGYLENNREQVND